MQRSRSQAQDDECSIDELAGNELLNTVPHEPVRLPSLHSLAAMSTTDILRPKSSRSTKTVPDDLDKPLPPIPKDPFAEQRQHWQNRPPLAKKTTNMKASDPGKVATKPKISSPILQEPEPSLAGPSLSRPGTGHTTQSVFGTQTSTADAAKLSKKISNLMQQAAAQESQTKQKAAIYAAESAKLSPFEKGKNAFVKATRAIKERLSSSSSSSSSNDKPFNTRRLGSIGRSSSGGWEPPPQYESQEELTRGRLDRRIAEGENLSNPKIQKLTGDGNIPRKPLPVYESMRSRSQHSGSDNPFSDADGEDGHLSPEDYSGFDFEFSKRKHKGKAVRASMPVMEQVDGPSEQSDQHLTVPKSTSRFSNMISGLAQHSDTEYFSSSPVGYSTPRIRLEPQPAANGNKVTVGALQRSPSVLEFSFEGQSEAASSEPQSPETRASEGSMSVKRKGATGDLRSQVAPASKKLKTNSISSKDEAILAAEIGQLATGDDRDLLSLESTNAVVAKPDRNASKRKGMSIFDLSKGKLPEGTGEDEAKKPWIRAIASKRSSVVRPSSVLFSRGRESRAGMRLEQVDGDDMDIDELQVDDLAFHVGGPKK